MFYIQFRVPEKCVYTIINQILNQFACYLQWMKYKVIMSPTFGHDGVGKKMHISKKATL